jgi:transposase
MGAAYPIELRERVVAAIDSGMSKGKAHQTYKVSRSTIDDWLELRQKHGCLRATTNYQRGPKPAIEDNEASRAFFEKHNLKTLAELCELWFEEKGQKLSIETMSKTLKRFAYTRKKRATVIKNEMN